MNYKNNLDLDFYRQKKEEIFKNPLAKKKNKNNNEKDFPGFQQ